METTATYDKTKLDTVLKAILRSVEEIALVLRYEDSSVVAGSHNTFGDKQLEIDVAADKIIFDNLKGSKHVSYALSEETPEPIDCGGQDFIVTFDPLDGSSIVDCNWTVGTIFGIWPNKDKLQGLTGHDQITAGIACYGPRTSVIYYDVEDKTVNEYTLHATKADWNKLQWVKTKSNLRIKESAKIFAPGNFRASSENKAYVQLMEYWRENKYTLRYIGGMASDCYQIFVKSGGIFCALSSESCQPKLRVLYECHPIAFVIEKAGGKTTDGKQSVLDIKIEGFYQKATFCAGSKDEIDRIEKAAAQ